MAPRKEVVYENGRLKGKMLNTSTCNKLEALLKLNKENGVVEDLRNVICELTSSEVDLIKSTKNNEFIDIDGRKGRLENTQTLGVAYMYFAERLILGDSVGMGKTVEVCGLCNLLEAEYTKKGMEFRFLLLTGKNLVSQVRDEMIKFTGNYIGEVQGVKDCVQKYIKENKEDILYSVVGSHSLVNSVDFQNFVRYYIEEKGYAPFDLIVIDEAGDILSNTSTQIYKNAKYLESNCDRVVLLNATAFEKELKQFYNQLDFIDDTLLPTKTAFSNEYEEKKWDYRVGYAVPSGKYKNAEKFRELVAYRYFARTRKETGAIMENCSAEVILSDLSPEQKSLLNKVSIPAMVYDCPSYFEFNGVETNIETTPKLKDLLGLIYGSLKDEKTILVYARYKEAQMCIKEILEEYDISCRILNGDSSQKEREDTINSFKLSDFRVLITNVQKGLNFGNCNACIFYDYDPNPNKMVQFEGRMTREYNIRNKKVFLLISRGAELKSFKTVVADRAQASNLFAGSDFSCVLSILLKEDKLKELV